MNDLDEQQSNKPLKTKIFHEFLILILVLVSSLIGIGITNYAPLKSNLYWSLMTLVLAFSATISGWYKSKRLGVPARQLLLTQVVHWVATIIALSAVFLLLKSGRLNFDNTGLVILVILGLSTFLDGFRLNWYYSFIGIIILTTGLLAAYLEQYLWILLVFSAFISVMIIFWEHRKKKQHE